ncbi:hypothetical protein [Natronobacterium gregoryi]|uniref:Uncharacterized protein n=2 Tax=Natronobacterium gregoryi TaxID=44930 RepID=L0AK36_NATGS|nr:hypothetical protein [Natronobacterium gregoryi]AFZ74141.1 hypothetical protein Natgr_3007 [Natronobacterium gregoryi SP2]ELY63878.1 hypothetical protein C490_15132 [Natronobacterium gregoryi SP2]PLK22064.1 hypothetical protein CYV19_01340 [Natronobacterium gregoryi SP2]SFI50209.1 hypothetical protein SAMN05443661_10127 [Natronobacterium gregoryi]
MSTRNVPPQSSSLIDRPQSSETTATGSETRPVTETAPATFSHRNTQRLENLFDEFNAAVATSQSASATET